jgi:ethanolamine utilization cobalamin adenosyltransferase
MLQNFEVTETFKTILEDVQKLLGFLKNSRKFEAIEKCSACQSSPAVRFVNYRTELAIAMVSSTVIIISSI